MSEPSEPDPSAPAEVRLRDLRPTDTPTVIVARVVSVQRREVTRKSDGGRRPVLSGLLSDGTATVRFTWWDPPPDEIDRGTILRAGPVQVREYRGRAEVSFTWRTRVAPASASELPELGAADLPPVSLSDLHDGDEGFRLEARVVRVSPKTVSVGEERRQLHEGILLDASGTVSFTAWSDFGLVEGEPVRVVGGYVRAFRGRPQLVLDERCHVERWDGRGLPTSDDWMAAGPTAIATVEANRGADHTTLEGVVVGVMPPSGVVYRCPTCRRTLSRGLCRLHGAVSGAPDLRARIVLDDGTGAATVNADRVATEKLWGRSLDECLAELRVRPDPSALEGQLAESLFGRRLRVRGRAVSDDFGVTLYPESVESAPPAPAADLGELERVARGETG
ncbi:MAG TPA: hypothetical protein VIZ68_05740 [Thermoplasmata archaeon]